MRLSLFLLVSTLSLAQPPGAGSDPANEPIRKAYAFLADKQYEDAVAFFLKGIAAAPARTDIRKDLAYTYLKIGENEAARDQFADAMRFDPGDFHLALEYAFLCHETKMQAEARRVFDRIRKTGDEVSRATAEQAFQNIDQPLAAGIERWKKALELTQESFTAHYELAGLAEQRDELELAAAHYGRAWELLRTRKQTLLDLGRVWRALRREDEANAAFLAASRGGEPRAHEAAAEFLPEHYPYVNDFRRALALDPNNIELRRELAFLWLAMERQPEAEREFLIILGQAPHDLLSCAQMGFLYLVRNDKKSAMPLLDRVMDGGDVLLSNRVRATLRRSLIETAAVRPPNSSDARAMAERSLESGYLKDALQYLQAAYAADPKDGWAALKLGWTYNILRADKLAYRWFRLARNSPDPAISSEARRAYRNLHSDLGDFRTTVWLFPFFSTRWHDTFAYGQVKTDLRLGALPFRPYVSMRLFGDTKLRTPGPLPLYLSESSVVLSVGLASSYWHGLMAWGEAGTAVSYLIRGPQIRRFTPDYRGGVSFGKGFGHLMGSEKAGLFFETNLDAVFVSRYDDDFLLYTQTRIGATPPRLAALGSFETQFFWNNNLIRDVKGVDWANYFETGPGIRFRWPWMPRSLLFSVSALRGIYTVPQFYRRPNFVDVRAGFFYASTH